jgi:hypothetical protein
MMMQWPTKGVDATFLAALHLAHRMLRSSKGVCEVQVTFAVVTKWSSLGRSSEVLPAPLTAMIDLCSAWLLFFWGRSRRRSEPTINISPRRIRLMVCTRYLWYVAQSSPPRFSLHFYVVPAMIFPPFSRSPCRDFPYPFFHSFLIFSEKPSVVFYL